jgi:ABC-type antimicrobial peptide transport system permease subunit
MSEAVQLLYGSSVFSWTNVLLYSAVAVSASLIVAFVVIRYHRRNQVTRNA